ncbi:hypothetical protein CONCODRAFT_77895 [Conidiobolus coronatus NRRL 28638]|uniref:Uncharacterized protein n=1 Tax=Conidiobolus coronatus (strain ATCC 28846 / CBS 209.66 / NRRL 28638) TaxID=796925 RepID=A0A137PB45_CONC2|nr:hypothetical protein CONCODRAFT_77895 [Conidiobolus coronatus NRRL 28638]|eukprot:KXN72225.1 hypothetical protein CONCODRAFT_77895 [Conidiobolus coronatus NRRL 28638]
MNNRISTTTGATSLPHSTLGSLHNKQKNYALMKIELEKLNTEFINFTDQVFKLSEFNNNLNQLTVIYSSMFMSVQKLEKNNVEEGEDNNENNNSYYNNNSYQMNE